MSYNDPRPDGVIIVLWFIVAVLTGILVKLMIDMGGV